jgi:hypothetical protein
MRTIVKVHLSLHERPVDSGGSWPVVFHRIRAEYSGLGLYSHQIQDNSGTVILRLPVLYRRPIGLATIQPDDSMRDVRGCFGPLVNLNASVIVVSAALDQ